MNPASPTTEMVERVAKAIWLRHNSQLHSASPERIEELWRIEDDYEGCHRAEMKWRPFARAAIEAMREPPFMDLRRMELAVEYEVNDRFGGDATVPQIAPLVWRHMIDAALSPEPQS